MPYERIHWCVPWRTDKRHSIYLPWKKQGMPSTGILTKKKFLSRMKTEMILCEICIWSKTGKGEDTYYIIWCQDFYGAAIGIAQKHRILNPLQELKNPFLPFNRNASSFPERSMINSWCFPPKWQWTYSIWWYRFISESRIWNTGVNTAM